MPKFKTKVNIIHKFPYQKPNNYKNGYKKTRKKRLFHSLLPLQLSLQNARRLFLRGQCVFCYPRRRKQMSFKNNLSFIFVYPESHLRCQEDDSDRVKSSLQGIISIIKIMNAAWKRKKAKQKQPKKSNTQNSSTQKNDHLKNKNKHVEKDRKKSTQPNKAKSLSPPSKQSKKPVRKHECLTQEDEKPAVKKRKISSSQSSPYGAFDFNEEDIPYHQIVEYRGKPLSQVKKHKKFFSPEEIPLRGHIELHDPKISSILRTVDFETNSLSKFTKFTSLRQITNLIRSLFTSDLAKVRSGFRWITKNIEYDKPRSELDPKSRPVLTSDEIVSSKKGICGDIAHLVKDMMKEMNIECQLIPGYTKGIGYSPTDNKITNHAWNAVKIDHRWYLLDATFSLAKITDSGIIAEPSDDYFLVDPWKFAHINVPEIGNEIWQLLEMPIDHMYHRMSPRIRSIKWFDWGFEFFDDDQESETISLDEAPYIVKQIRCKRSDVEVTASIRMVDIKNPDNDSFRKYDKVFERSAFVRRKGEAVVITAGFKVQGIYELNIFANTKERLKTTKKLDGILSYFIINNAEIPDRENLEVDYPQKYTSFDPALDIMVFPLSGIIHKGRTNRFAFVDDPRLDGFLISSGKHIGKTHHVEDPQAGPLCLLDLPVEDPLISIYRREQSENEYKLIFRWDLNIAKLSKGLELKPLSYVIKLSHFQSECISVKHRVVKISFRTDFKEKMKIFSDDPENTCIQRSGESYEIWFISRLELFLNLNPGISSVGKPLLSYRHDFDKDQEDSLEHDLRDHSRLSPFFPKWTSINTSFLLLEPKGLIDWHSKQKFKLLSSELEDALVFYGGTSYFLSKSMKKTWAKKIPLKGEDSLQIFGLKSGDFLEWVPLLSHNTDRSCFFNSTIDSNASSLDRNLRCRFSDDAISYSISLLSIKSVNPHYFILEFQVSTDGYYMSKTGFVQRTRSDRIEFHCTPNRRNQNSDEFIILANRGKGNTMFDEICRCFMNPSLISNRRHTLNFSFPETSLGWCQFQEPLELVKPIEGDLKRGQGYTFKIRTSRKIILYDSFNRRIRMDTQSKSVEGCYEFVVHPLATKNITLWIFTGKGSQLTKALEWNVI